MSRKVWQRPWVHALLLAGVLVACSAFVGLRAHFFIDEAAFHAQLEARDRGGWLVERPFADRDVGLEHVPMALSDVVDGGIAPFAKHPVHVLLAQAMHDLAGRAGIRALSTVGVLVAALGAAASVSHRGRAVALATMWTAALATPLIFYGQLVVGHALGAGVAAVLLWRVFSADPRRLDVLVVAALAAAGVLLRAEFLLLLGAVGAVVLGWAIARRERTGLARASAGLAAGIAAYMGEPMLVERWVGAEVASRSTSASLSLEGGAEGRLDGAIAALLQPDYARPGVLNPLTVMLVTVLGAAALHLVARRDRDRPVALLLAGGAVTAAAVHLTVPDLVPGLVWAFPALWFVWGLRRDDLDDRLVKSSGVALVFAAAVLGTQYSIAGGGVEWGWRYYAIGLPALAPVLAVGLVSIWRRARGDRSARVVVVLVATASLLVPVSGLLEQRRYLSDTQYFLDRVEEVTADVDFVVTLDPSFGRLAYPLALDSRVAPVAESTSRRLFGWLEDDGAERVLLVWRTEEPPQLGLGPYRIAGEPIYIASDFRGIELTLSNARSPS